MKPKYAALCCYFGHWPSHFAFWLKSCLYNEGIDFLLVSDIPVDGYELPANVKLHRLSFAQVQQRICDCFAQELSPAQPVIDRPYKLCDYKTAFGYLFADLFAGYDYWGYYDIDTIWGNIQKFIPANQDNHLVKIFPCGHLSFIRNEAPYDQVFRLVNEIEGNPCRSNMTGKTVVSWQYCFTSSDSYYYDEEGGLEPWFEVHPQVHSYFSVDFDNILPPWRFDHFLSINFPQKSQFLAFSFEEGRLFRHFLQGFHVVREETSYLHVSKRCLLISTDDTSRYVIYPNMIGKWGRWEFCNLLWLARPRYIQNIIRRIIRKYFRRITN